MNKNKKRYDESLVKRIYKLSAIFIITWISALSIILVQFVYFYHSAFRTNVYENIENYADNMEHAFDKLENSIYALANDSNFHRDINLIGNYEDVLLSYGASNRVQECMANFKKDWEFVEAIEIYNKNGDKVWRDGDVGEEMPCFSTGIYSYYCNDKENENLCITSKMINKKGEEVARANFRLNVSKIYSIGNEEISAFIITDDGVCVGYNVPKDDDFNKYIENNGVNLKKTQINKKKVFVASYTEEKYRFNYCKIMESMFIEKSILKVIILAVAILIMLIIYTIWFCFKYISDITVPIQDMKASLNRLEKNNYVIDGFPDIQENEKNEIHLFEKHLYNVIKRMNEYVEENYIIECHLKEAQLKNLHAQINPHFIYNTLNVLYWKAEERNQDDIAFMIKNIGALFRYSIDNTDKMIPLEHEINMIKDYVCIHKMRFEERLDVAIDIAEECKNVMIPKFSVQPLLENSIIATVRKSAGDFKIKLCAKKMGECIEICVMDEGEGIPEEDFESILSGTYNDGDTISMLYNINQRIKYMFGKEYGIFAERRDDMFTVGFKIPA